MQIMALLMTSGTFLLLVACANPINAKTATNYAQAAARAQKAGDWENAQNYWSRAIVNAQLAGATPSQLAALNYEYGRSSGAVCDYAEAERALKAAYDLDNQSGGPAFMALFELARLNLDQKKFVEAINYFDRAFQIAEEKGVSKASPIGTAEALEEYSSALNKVGKSSESETAATRAAMLRRANPVGHSITDRTPYGRHCPSKAGL